MTTAQSTTKTGQSLQSRPFTGRPTLIPQFVNGEFTGRPYKVEQVLLRGEEGGARMHLWLAPDPRPHNHPWHWIDCQVLRGFYTALEYIPDGYGDYIERELTLTAGDPVHRVKYQTHHQIVRVHPGTVTIMSFGPIVGDGKQWGHLVKDDDSFRYEPNSAPPQFVDALRHLNPHLRPVGWVDPFHHLPVPSLDEIMDSIGL